MPFPQQAGTGPDAPAMRLQDSAQAQEVLTRDEIERAPRLCVEPDASRRILPGEEHHKPGIEKFRFLSHRLHHLRQRRAIRSVLVTSAVPREGKTVVAANLALILARTSPRVLLVDGDLRAPGIGGVLGLAPLPGLAEFLEGRMALGEVLRRVDPQGCYYVPAGHAGTSPVELLEGERAGEFMRAARMFFDWVVIDSPPLVPFADAHCLARMADAVLLVVRAELTLRKDLQRAVAALEGTHLAGVVLNAHDDPHQNSYYSYYSRCAAPGGNP